MTNLTEPQRQALLAAAQAPDGAINAPADAKPLKLLLKRGLFITLTSQEGADRLAITDAGRHAIGEPGGDDAPAPAPAPARNDRRRTTITEPTGKLGAMVQLLKRPDGAVLADMMAATGWQAHSVRGAMSGALKKGFGYVIASDKTETGRVYRIASGEEA